MKSLRSKIILLVLFGSFLSSFIVGILSIRNTREQIHDDSNTIMKQSMINTKQTIDNTILRIEQSVTTMADCFMNSLTDFEKFTTSQEYVDSLTENLRNTMLSAAINTDGAITAYIRYNPDFTDPTSGIFYSRNNLQSDFEELEPTDFSMYDKTDTAHVGWYYIPVENKKPTWMSPYLNENLQVYMVSYVIPLYMNDTSIGIIGMDIEFSEIQSIIDNTSIYQSGYAFLTNQDNQIMYHNSLPVNQNLNDLNDSNNLSPLINELSTGCNSDKILSYKFNGVEKMMFSDVLKNDMCLVLTAPSSEINASENRLVVMIIGSAFVAVILALLVSLFIIQSIVKPLVGLNRVTGKIADGDLDVSVNCRSKDEIGQLADSIRRTVERLKDYILYISEISAVLEQIAQGNLVFKLQYEYTGEFSKIRNSLLDISDSLSRTIKEIGNSSDMVRNGCVQLTSGAQALSEGVTTQAASVQELSATMREIAEKVRFNAENAQLAFGKAKEASDSVLESNKNMAEMSVAIRNIAVTSEKITQIVKTVEDIASQTNILALNAAVESARAGAAGKGFAVVAGEVRTLATQVNAATNEISQLVNDESIVVADGLKFAEKTEKSLENVVEKSSIIVEKLQEISEASKWQSVSIEQVNNGIERISEVVQSNSATAQKDAASSVVISEQAELLQNLIDQFQIDEK